MLKPNFNPIDLFREIEKLFPEWNIIEAMQIKTCRKIIMREIKKQLMSIGD